MAQVPFHLCTLATCDMSRALYQYIPSLGANVFFLVWFGCVMIFSCVVCLKSKNWFFAIAMICGSLCEIVGYIGRVISHENPFRLTPFLIQICCLTMGPAYFSAAIYYCLSKIVIIFGPEYSRLRPSYYTILFCLCDLISLSLQGAGGGLASVASENLRDPYLGDDIMLAGLCFQVFSLLLFIILAVEYFYRVSKSNRTALSSNRRFLATTGSLALALILIFTRCVYRIVELSEGWNGYLIGVEVYFIVLEGL
ncbi:Sphingoid long-chain base transporter RSB1 [Penicillium rolfsii]|nr:Sphingoid long-chain base transporter RSB1 [Penicillium rolfsii]